MRKNGKRALRPIVATVSLLGLLGFANPVQAVDGVIEINQAKALAGGVVPADTAGFPVTINQPGSYRLTGNLTVPDENTDGINIFAKNVTLDLNGFAIVGPVVCSGSPLTCDPSGTGDGIFAGGSTENATVVNGTVSGMGRVGVFLRESARVENVHSFSNGLHGIFVRLDSRLIGNVVRDNGGEGISVIGYAIVHGNAAQGNKSTGIIASGVVTENTVYFNGADGIAAGISSVVRGNVVRGNTSRGIICIADCTVSNNTASLNDVGILVAVGRGRVTGNVVTENTGFGLVLTNPSSYADNVLTLNNGGNTEAQVFGGIETGTNVCGTNTTCP